MPPEMNGLADKKCVPCEGGVPALSRGDAEKLLTNLRDWTLEGAKQIRKEFKFKGFAENLAFVNAVGAIAEREGHHPNLYLYDWNKLRVELETHAVKGLTENDFIVAAKIDALTLSR